MSTVSAMWLLARMGSLVPPTGDPTDIYMWVCLLLLAADLLLGVILFALCSAPKKKTPSAQSARGRRR